MSSESPEGRKPKAPAGLSAAGRALWRRIADEYDLDVWEVVVLEAACRQAGDIANLEALLADQGMTVVGSMGQSRLNPALTELRQARLALGKLLDQLALPVGDEEEGESPVARSAASRRAQKAALSRHNRERLRREQIGLPVTDIAERRRRLTGDGA